ncbi:Haem-binding domain-containing protein [Maribacter aquivivus]|uniref:Haem-binding domain-containing protein n=1 Tax=Maribacter aquivivus TaxID=228958 RepID=A0A1M6IZL3_9FLAO|nr:heme-binding domain-containing protein [Maribacter aquivivus]SHJ39879.1 Haem-binding domain-containing protein [Maribacter aquivivus]
MWKKAGIAIVIILIVIQFIRPDKNVSGDETFAIETKYSIPNDVENILQVSCYDCHSNTTEYPWYSNVQPIAWFLDEHVTDGKKHLNFSEFTNKPLFVQNHKLEETIEMVEEKEMPLPSYTYFGLHQEADLTDAQRQKIIDWANSQMSYLKETYPADSLAFPKRD